MSGSRVDPGLRSDAAARWWLFGLLALALVVRLVLFTGFFGSDDVTYLSVASDIAHGRWVIYDYIGSLRYGVNIPNAVLLRLLGVGVFQATLWALLCSLGEIAAVYVIAFHMWGLRAAIFSTVLIGLLPIHVHEAGLVLADSPAALAITLSLVLFHTAEYRNKRAIYFLAGIAAGAEYWVKEVVIIFIAVFALYAVVERRWNWRWLWVVAGTAVMLAANCALLWWITGDPFYIIHITTRQVSRYVHKFSFVQTSPWFYFRYLLLDIQHTWLLGYMVLAGVWLWLRRLKEGPRRDPGMRYVMVWAAGLFLVFSLTPISLFPLKLIAKQSNYMLLFVAPLCLIGGWWLSRCGKATRWLVLTTWIAGAFILSVLEQQSISVFTANSKATVTFARAHPDARVFALANGYGAGIYAALLDDKNRSASVVGRLRTPLRDVRTRAHVADSKAVWAVFDTETLGWGRGDPRSLAAVPNCWVRSGVLSPEGLGWETQLVKALGAVLEVLGPMAPTGLRRRFDDLTNPRPAYVYRVPVGCR